MFEQHLRKARPPGGGDKYGSQAYGSGLADRDVFDQVIEAAHNDGLSVEAWLKNAIDRVDEPHLSSDARTLRRLLDVQHRSRAEADRLAREAYSARPDFLAEPAPSVDDAIKVPETSQLMSAIDGLTAQLTKLNGGAPKRSNSAAAIEPHQDQKSSQTNETAQPQPESHGSVSKVDHAARLSSLLVRVAQLRKQVNGEEPVAARIAPDLQSSPMTTKDGAESVVEPYAETLARLEANFQTIERSLKDLPNRDDLAPLQPLTQLHLKLQQEQSAVKTRLDDLSDCQNAVLSAIRQLQLPEPQSSEPAFAALQAQIADLEACLTALQPASSQEVARLLDMAINKMELIVGSAGETWQKTQAPGLKSDDLDAMSSSLHQLHKRLESLPSEIAQTQPNPQSLISFLPPRDTLEAMEATLGRVEALLLDEARLVSSDDAEDSQGMADFHQRFDDLLSRLDDTVKRFDMADLAQDERASFTIEQVLGSNEALTRALTAQINRLEEVFLSDTEMRDLQDSSAEERAIEALFSIEMGQVKSLLSDMLAQQGSQMDLLQHPPRPIADPDEAAREREALLAPILDALDGLSAQIELQHTHSSQHSDNGSGGDGGAVLRQMGAQLTGLEREVSALKDLVNQFLSKATDKETVTSVDPNSDLKENPGFDDRSDELFSEASADDGLKRQIKTPKYQEILLPRSISRPTGVSEVGADNALENGSKASRSGKSQMDFVAAARRARWRKADQAGSYHGSASRQSHSSKIVGSVIARIKDLCPKDDGLSLVDIDPYRRRKILFASAAILAVSVALVMTLQGVQDSHAPQTPLATGSITGQGTALIADKGFPHSGMVGPGFGSDNGPSGVASSGALTPDNDMFLGRKFSVRVMEDTSTAVEIAQQQVRPVQNIPTVLPVSRPHLAAESAYIFVAPAPEESIGPVALRYRAATGDAVAQFEVASRYADGFGVAKDMQQAAAWYGRAAAKGLAPAQYRLGSLMEHGIGVAEDKKAAAQLYYQAAAAGNRRSMYNLGVLYAGGAITDDGHPDFAMAREWFIKAGEAGFRDAQFNLAVLYSKGVGVEMDASEAYYWFALAGAAGDEEAQRNRTLLAEPLKQQLGTSGFAALDAKIANWQPAATSKDANIVAMPTSGWIDIVVPPMAETQLQKLAQAGLSENGTVVGGLTDSLASTAAASGNVFRSRFPSLSDI